MCASFAFAGETTARRVTSVVRADPRSGRLVRSVVVTPITVASHKVPETVIAPRVVSPSVPAPEPAPAAGIDQAVEQVAARHALPPQLIHSVIKVESNYNPFAVSPKGALGLMQLIPATARRFGVADVFNPAENIEGGAKYLRYLLDLYDNQLGLALAAYNAGEKAVARYGAVPPYRETEDYLRLVAAQLKKENAKRAEKERASQPAPAAAPDGVNHIRQIQEPDGTVRYVTR
jgi:soluble lytic murein transglycosylase-like protein